VRFFLRPHPQEQRLTLPPETLFCFAIAVSLAQSLDDTFHYFRACVQRLKRHVGAQAQLQPDGAGFLRQDFVVLILFVPTELARLILTFSPRDVRRLEERDAPGAAVYYFQFIKQGLEVWLHVFAPNKTLESRA
jgi:hypothetical protein